MQMYFSYIHPGNTQKKEPVLTQFSAALGGTRTHSVLLSRQRALSTELVNNTKAQSSHLQVVVSEHLRVLSTGSEIQQTYLETR